MMREWADTRRLLGMIDGSLIARKTSDTPPIHRVTLISPMGFLPELRLRCPLWYGLRTLVGHCGMSAKCASVCPATRSTNKLASSTTALVI